MGANRLIIEVEDAEGKIEETPLSFSWDPRPLPLPLDLSDLSRFSHIQEVGQIVNGAFDLDIVQNVIRSRAPVATRCVHRPGIASRWTGSDLYCEVSRFFRR